MLTSRIEQIKYAYKTCLEFTELVSSDHVNDQNHSHSTIEIACIMEGHGNYWVSNDALPFSPGDVLVFNSMERHNICSVQPGMLRITAVNFDPEYIAHANDSNYDLQYLDTFYFTNRRGALKSGDECAAEIHGIIRSMAREFDEKRSYYPLVIKAQLLNILAILLRASNAGKDENGQAGYLIKRQDSIATVLSFIERNLSSDISIDALSSLVYMNRYYFSTFFKKYVGETPIQYITRKRVAMAMTLLDTTSLSILEIATRSGFNNSSNFNRAFKQVTGKSPSDFKKRK